MSDYDLTAFTGDLNEILTAGGELDLARVAEKLQQLLANPAFVEATFDEAEPPGKRVLHHDEQTDAYVLAHVHSASKNPGLPHSHGTSWAVYGNARGTTTMTIWQRVNPAADDHAELMAVDKYVLEEGRARPYPPGTIHSTEQPGKAWVVRVTGTDLDVLPRYRFGKSDRMLEAQQTT